MKKYSLLMAVIALALVAVSCTPMLPARFERFVNKVEKNASSYTKEDWNSVTDQFADLVEEYQKSYDKLSKEDRQRIDKAIGRFGAIAIKSGMSSAVQTVNEAVSGLSSTLQNVVEGVGSFLKELGIDSGASSNGN